MHLRDDIRFCREVEINSVSSPLTALNFEKIAVRTLLTLARGLLIMGGRCTFTSKGPEGKFEELVNKEMIDLDPMSEADLEILRKMVRNHFSYTSSTVALNILNDWDAQKALFVKVMPRDYKAVLAQRKTTPKVEVKLAVATA